VLEDVVVLESPLIARFDCSCYFAPDLNMGIRRALSSQELKSYGAYGPIMVGG
jgi:hypothetical protein